MSYIWIVLGTLAVLMFLGWLLEQFHDVLNELERERRRKRTLRAIRRTRK